MSFPEQFRIGHLVSNNFPNSQYFTGAFTQISFHTHLEINTTYLLSF